MSVAKARAISSDLTLTPLTSCTKVHVVVLSINLWPVLILYNQRFITARRLVVARAVNV